MLAFVKEYMRHDRYHGVSRACARKRALLTGQFKANKISTEEYHRQMDRVHAQYPEDWQKIQEVRDVQA